MPKQDLYDILVVGGGFFGMCIAEFFAKKGKRVLLCEKEPDFMQRASFSNQARVHNGYHYPRSILTALRSRVSFSRFAKEFPSAIVSSFDKVYMIGRNLSKVTSKQFKRFCDRIGAPCERAPHHIARLASPQYVEGIFSTTEYAFNAQLLKEIMRSRLEQAGVQCIHDTEARTVSTSGTGLCIQLRQTNSERSVEAKQVFNCTYSALNQMLQRSKLPMIPLKHEWTEMCVVKASDELKNLGITMMCGPFFSLNPFPSLGLHTLSHVRYTPHYHWFDNPNTPLLSSPHPFQVAPPKSAWTKMLADVKRYLPSLSNCTYQKSIWEVKTILPSTESNDARPILFKKDYALKGLHCVLGAKIDNIYDVLDFIEKKGLCQ